MKALVKTKAEEGIWLQDMPEPKCGNNDVIVKIHKTAICGTDIHIYNWDEWAQKTVPVPMITGHEYAGEIVEVGKNITDLSVGDIVLFPASLFHRTLPFSADEERICVAFDLKPGRPANGRKAGADGH